ncbi:MliC family protein [Paracoccus albus]|uniref:MliC family protein n=1 Tax=Paracoccus albus TaxID=3017784 RepID=UPI0022F05E14|nr:MliC family protein [Paracoccus albus]WBU60175.1 MliC family protein [Paracoccus albus]
MRHLPLLAALFLPATAFAESEMFTVNYVCPNDASFQVAFINAAEDSFAVMDIGDGLVPMQIAQSGSGARYLSEDAGLELWTKGSMATVSGDEAASASYKDCAEMEAGTQPG